MGHYWPWSIYEKRKSFWINIISLILARDIFSNFSKQLSVLVSIIWDKKFERSNNNVFGLKDWLILTKDLFVNNTKYFHAVHCHYSETNFESNGFRTDGSLVSWPLFRLQPLDNQSFFCWIFNLGVTLCWYYCCLTAAFLTYAIIVLSSLFSGWSMK